MAQICSRCRAICPDDTFSTCASCREHSRLYHQKGRIRRITVSGAGAGSGSGSGSKICATRRCPEILPPNYPFKTCLSCRERNKQYRALLGHRKITATAGEPEVKREEELDDSLMDEAVDQLADTATVSPGNQSASSSSSISISRRHSQNSGSTSICIRCSAPLPFAYKYLSCPSCQKASRDTRRARKELTGRTSDAAGEAKSMENEIPSGQGFVGSAPETESPPKRPRSGARKTKVKRIRAIPKQGTYRQIYMSHPNPENPLMSAGAAASGSIAPPVPTSSSSAPPLISGSNALSRRRSNRSAASSSAGVREHEDSQVNNLEEIRRLKEMLSEKDAKLVEKDRQMEAQKREVDALRVVVNDPDVAKTIEKLQRDLDEAAGHKEVLAQQVKDFAARENEFYKKEMIEHTNIHVLIRLLSLSRADLATGKVTNEQVLQTFDNLDAHLHEIAERRLETLPLGFDSIAEVVGSSGRRKALEAFSTNEENDDLGDSDGTLTERSAKRQKV